VPDRTPHVTVARARSVPGGGDRGARGQALEFSALAGALALAGLGVYRRHRPRL
jgi:hypothetical protein